MPIIGTGTAAVTSSAMASITPSTTMQKAPASATARASDTIFLASASLLPRAA
jgi:hypothetical protein